ncbi:MULTISPECIES: diadenylate cyclase CdaA [Sporolactobacillus]|uniref:Diadenylate cyclase n=3 Tax=Sporolactobacillus TaxID=2077 RepID=A0A0U1QMS6_9BACL|nr:MULTISPECIES: diadenylate cyclase CdaA [Sporolactobacillus]KLI02101.1 membrane protein [Sporolactobacillus inulinus CASD]QAA21356.1 TIGR00159 family protein [Sporolactobacillus terrae]QAA24328.1 TIGR00159 family protein [Sporolactobacillus terrae]UAK16150.1 diadenylate cyclase CdaA [Sporolactobacillus terrae]BBN97574.1 cyclic di-AMP synthase CdaA [Sporolactobacillus terrae]
MPLWTHINILNYLTDIIDILIVTYVIYKVIMIIRGTKAVQLAKGILVIVAVWFLSSLFQLRTLEWILNNAITYGLFAIIVIFQPELRRLLEQLGRGRLFSRGTQVEEEHKQMADAIVKATSYMAKRRIGALMSIERKTGLNEYIETGIQLNGNLTSQLLINIFIPNTPLHDGAVIIRGTEVVAAACYLPLSESPFISKELGTRHRAAMGVSEVTDSLTVVVSEETGGITVTKNGEMFREISEERLQEMLQHELDESDNQSPVRWNWRGKHNG